ncbi:hypothetical protein X777_00578, partial [Ooceraea biroi]
VAFCRFVLRKVKENPDFAANILFTDEAIFTNNRIINFHNNHIWADENPHAVVESRHQHRFSLNVWVGILRDRLIGPRIRASFLRRCEACVQMEGGYVEHLL